MIWKCMDFLGPFMGAIDDAHETIETSAPA